MGSKTVTAHDKDKKEHVVRVQDLTWRPAIWGVTIKGGRILLSQQFDGYALPGGGIELGEHYLDAIVRETKEETGINVRPAKLLGIESGFYVPFMQEDKVFHSIIIFYQCQYLGGELSSAGYDEFERHYTADPEWVELARLEDIKLASSFDYRPYVRLAKHSL